MKSLYKNNHKREWLFVVAIIAITLGRIVYLYAFEKTGEHSDEIWSYGLANSYYKPYIFQNNEGTEYIHVDEWIGGQELKEYITVQPGERFNYKSVTYNLKRDFHPPLYFYMLHTICSFFPNTYSRWFAFSINIVVFPILMVFLYLLAKELSRGEKYIPCFVLLVYGLAAGGVSTFIFARHYAMLTMWAVMYAYYFVKWIKQWWKTTESQEKNSDVRFIVILTVISALGCLTQYFFATFAFILTVMVIIACLCKKQIKRMFIFGSAMVVSLLPMFAMSGVLNSTVSRTNGINNNGGETSLESSTALWKKFKTCLECFSYDFTAIKFSKQIDYYINMFFTTIALIIVISIPIVFLTIKKNKEQFKHWICNKKEHVRKNSVVYYINATLIIVCLFSCVAYCVLSGDDNMEALTNRYLFIVYPIYVIIFVGVINLIIGKISSLFAKRIVKVKESDVLRVRNYTKLVLMIVAAQLFIFGTIKSEIYYLFPRVENQNKIEEITNGANVILPMTEHWLLTCYTDVLQDADNIFVTSSKSYKTQTTDEHVNLMREIPNVEYSNNKLYLLMDVSKIKQGVEMKTNLDEGPELIAAITDRFNSYYESVFPGKHLKYIQQDVIFTREVYLYEIN